MFDEAEVESTDEYDLNAFGSEEIETEQAISSDKPQQKSVRNPLPDELDRVVIEHDISDEEKTCDCGCQKTHIGDYISEQLDIIPTVVQVLQHR